MREFFDVLGRILVFAGIVIAGIFLVHRVLVDTIKTALLEYGQECDEKHDPIYKHDA